MMSQFVIKPDGDSWQLYENPSGPRIASGPTREHVKERAFETLRTRVPCKIRITGIEIVPFEEWKLDSRQGDWCLNSYTFQRGDHIYGCDYIPASAGEDQPPSDARWSIRVDGDDVAQCDAEPDDGADLAALEFRVLGVC